MKKIVSILVFVAFGVVCATAQNTAGPVMTFELKALDHGTIEKGAAMAHEFNFKFTNTGNEPLIIKVARGSCGCTVPTWPQEPIMPGESASIRVLYSLQRVGPFTHTVTLTTNETPDTHELTIKGEVKEPAPPEATPAVDDEEKN